MANADLIAFIKEARRRGFDDYEIRTPLIERGWPVDEVEAAFSLIKQKLPAHKHKICVYVDDAVLKKLEKRAKSNLFTLEEQIVDILRRSVVNTRVGMHTPEKLDDMLGTLFSRKTRKR